MDGRTGPDFGTGSGLEPGPVRGTDFGAKKIRYGVDFFFRKIENPDPIKTIKYRSRRIRNDGPAAQGAEIL